MKRAALLALCVALVAACVESPGIVEYWPPLPEPGPPTAPEELVGALEHYYRERNLDRFAGLLADDPDNHAVYEFVPAAADSGTAWDRAMELHAHRRMFDPEDLPAGEPAVPHELWLQAVNIALEQVTPWQERTDLYRSDTVPGGLPPEKWKAVEAGFSTFVFFETQTDRDFLVQGEAIFVVIEDLQKSGAAPGRFLLLRWQDIDVEPAKAVETASWTQVKTLYLTPGAAPRSLYK